MVRLCLLPIVLWVTSGLAAPFDNSSLVQDPDTFIPSRACKTESPSEHLQSLHIAMNMESRKRAPPKTQKYRVNTYFHVVTTNDQKNAITRSMIANQLGALQAAYASSGITFVLQSTDYTVNDTWATDENDADMKIALRKGNYSALNVYFQSNLSTTAYGDPELLLGYCTLPTNITYSPCDGCPLETFPASNYALDGCNVLAGTMPGGPIVGYNQGKTAVHEVGHWFGLLHTFNGNACGPGNDGDFIDDTPQESVSTDGCPTNKDSCPDSPGLDPVHNFMDYSTDACYEGFTPQQVTRIQNMFGSLRFGH